MQGVVGDLHPWNERGLEFLLPPLSLTSTHTHIQRRTYGTPPYHNLLPSIAT
jgi:hypothetical protein